MIKKENLWFTLLFSIILVLSIFYIGMTEDVNPVFEIEDVNTTDETLVINENTELVALRIKNDEELEATMNELQSILLSETASVQEKNDAYDSLLQLTNNKGNEQSIEKIIKEEFKFESFVKIAGNNITIVIKNENHDYALANNIIRRVQKDFDVNKYITVKFN